MNNTHEKLKDILNRAFPIKSGITLEVEPVQMLEYNVRIYKNGIFQEDFTINEAAGEKLVKLDEEK